MRLFSLFPSPAKAVPCLAADLVYIAGLVLSIFSGTSHVLVLVGLVGIGVNVARSYRLFLAERGYFPFWWFLPTLVFPWTSLWINAGGPGGGEVRADGGTGRFRLSTTILCTLIAALLVASSFFQPMERYSDRMLAPMEEPGQEYLLETSKQVGIAFATARLLNGMLSLVEEMEISAELGVGATVSPGEVLEPLDDLAERFSEIMLISFVTVSGILLLGEIGELIGLGLLAPLGLLLLAVSLWQAPDRRRLAASTGYRILLLGLFLRLFVPAIGVGSTVLDRLVLQEKQAEAVEKMPEFVRKKAEADAVVERTGRDTAQSGETARETDPKPFYGIFSIGADVKDKMGEIRRDLVKLKDSLPQIIDSIVEQIVVFVLKSMVLPLLFLLVLIRFYKWLSGSPHAGSGVERRLKELLSRAEREKGEAVADGSAGR